MLLADDAVVGPARGDGPGDHVLGCLVRRRHRVEGASASFVGDVQRLAEVGPDDLARRVGERMREIDEVLEIGQHLICHSIALAQSQDVANKSALCAGITV